MQRSEPGKVKLEAPVKTYLPGLPEASIEQCDAGCARI
jgi:CubicO group peptidase (beta-lactamase class C family)